MPNSCVYLIFNVYYYYITIWWQCYY